MNMRSQSIKALSLITLLSVSSAYPMSWVKQQIQRFGSYVPAVPESVKKQVSMARGYLPASSRLGMVVGATAAAGLGALAYNAYNSPNALPSFEDVLRQNEAKNSFSPAKGIGVAVRLEDPLSPAEQSKIVTLLNSVEPVEQKAQLPIVIRDNPIAPAVEQKKPIADSPMKLATQVPLNTIAPAVEPIVVVPVPLIDTPLHIAVRNGDMAKVTELLAQLKTRAERNDAIHKSINPDGYSVMRLANHMHQFDILCMLITEIGKSDKQW